MKKFLLIIVISFKLFAQNEVCFDVIPNPMQNVPGFSYFTKYVNVLDCIDIFAEPSISDEKVLHVAAIAA